MLLGLGASRAARAWEGHDWNDWRKVATWRRPDLTTDQTGRTNLVPLLGPGADGTRVTNVVGWETRRAGYANAIRAMLGAPTDLRPPAPEARELGREELDGYTRIHLQIRAEPEDWIPAYLLLPKSRPQGRSPTVLCLHQTVAQGKEESCGIRGDPELAFAVELVKRGFVCLAPDVLGFGERIPAGKQPYHDSLAFYRRHPGWSYMGKMVWDISRIVDWLETRPEVDPQRIASIGHSHGAYGTLFAAAFEPRLAAAIASCGFSTFRSDANPVRWSHLTALIPQLGFYLPDTASIPFDWHHVLALAAPRPTYVWYSTRDAIFPRTSNLPDVLWDVRSVDALLGARDAITWQAYEGGHQFPKAGREAAYRWLEETLGISPSTPPVAAPAAAPRPSAFFPAEVRERARANAATYAWAATIRDSLVSAAEPWLRRSDDELGELMFDHSIRRAWQVWSDGHCPACRQPVPMYEWIADALNQPWKLRCPRCRELFPKNDFARFYRSGLDAQGRFEPHRADRSLLFNTEHPDPADPLHGFGVDDGEGWVADGHRWRFIGAYLIFGQWKQAIVAGIRHLADAWVATGDPRYARKAGVLLDRVADFYPDFDFATQGVMYEGPPRSGYVSTWHDACVEVLDLALAWDAVREGLAADPEFTALIAAKAGERRLPYTKTGFEDIRRHIENRIFRDTLSRRFRIESNYPSTDVTIATLRTVLDWPANRDEVMALLDAIIRQATAVDGVTGEKGIAGYTLIAPHAIAALLGRYARADPGFIREAVRRHPQLHAMYRFHLDTLCLGQYYPRIGDTGSVGERTPGYAGLPFTRNPGVNPSSYAFLWDLSRATGDRDFARLLLAVNGGTTDGLPYDLFATNPDALQGGVRQVLAGADPEIRLRSVNKPAWGLAILRSGAGPNARAAWLDYDSGERHGHADAMNLGLFAYGLDLLPDFGYPPVQYGGWYAPRATWYTRTAAHNTVTVDGRDSRPGTGRTTLWFDGDHFHAVRASAPALIGGTRFERTLALVDFADDASYVVDVFRVRGGREHAKQVHGTFGRLAAPNLNLAPTQEPSLGDVLREFRLDPKPPAVWSAEWQVEDYFHYLPAGKDVRLTCTELTPGTEVLTSESWVAVGMFGGTAQAWIPGLTVRRRAAVPELTSTFVSVFEPHEGPSRIAGVRRLDLHGPDAGPATEAQVALEVTLTDGRRDLLASARAEPLPGQDPEGDSPRPIGEPNHHLTFDGDFAAVRLAPDGRPARLVMCRARSLQIGEVQVRLRDAEASVELDLGRVKSPVVAGPAEAVELVRIGERQLLPEPPPAP